MQSRTSQLLWAIALIAAAVLAIVLAQTRKPGDFPVYIQAAERLVAGDVIYRPDDPPAFTYPPFFALPFVPLVYLPPFARLTVWTFANLLLLGAIIRLVRKLVQPHIDEGRALGGPPGWVAWLVIAILSARFLISPIEYQAHDLIVVWLVLLGIVAWSERHDWRAGWWLGLATACKATPLLFLPVLCWQRRWGGVLVCVVTIAAATVLPDAIYPSCKGGLWARAWYDTFVSKTAPGQTAEASGAWEKWNALNQSLPGSMYRWSTPVENRGYYRDVSLWDLPEPLLTWVVLGLEMLVLAAIAAATWSRTPKLQEDPHPLATLGQAGTVASGMLLLSPMSSKHHFCILVIPLAYLTVRVLYHRRGLVPIVGLVACFLLGTCAAKDLVGRSLGDLLQAYGALTLCAAACLVACAWELTCRRFAASRFSREEDVLPALVEWPAAELELAEVKKKSA